MEDDTEPQNPGFRGKAPADVIANDESRLVELTDDIERLQATLGRLGGRGCSKGQAARALARAAACCGRRDR